MKGLGYDLLSASLLSLTVLHVVFASYNSSDVTDIIKLIYTVALKGQNQTTVFNAIATHGGLYA